MKCTATLGYGEVVLVRAADGREARFRPGHKTLTGAKHRNGDHMCLTASSVRRYLQLQDLKQVRDSVELDSDKGIFDPVSAEALDMNARMCYDCTPVDLRILAGAFYLAEQDKRKRRG